MVRFHCDIDANGNISHGSRNLLSFTSSSSNSKTTAFHSVTVLDKEEQRMGTGTRWNPTPEQIQVLEEMYRCGLRTPTAHQIQQIACQLTKFGKVQGKNVFYWFQNHKARERQKRRRELISAPGHSLPFQQQCCIVTNMSPAVALRRSCADHNNNWGYSSRHPLTLSRESTGYMHRVPNGQTTVGRRHTSSQMVQLTPGHLQFFHPMEFDASNKFVNINGITRKEDDAGKAEILQLFPTKSEDCFPDIKDINQPFFNAGYKPVQFFQFL